MIRFNKGKDEVQFNSVEELFRADRKTRISLFGQYITTEKASLEKILELARAKQEESKQWQSNLETLVKYLEEENKKATAEKLQEAVNAMNAEQLAELKKLIEAKEGKQE